MLNAVFEFLIQAVMRLLGAGLRLIGAVIVNWVVEVLISEVLWPVISWPFRWLWSRRQNMTRWFQGG
jgi:hypothetical protein